jgi:DNA-binding MarR family transcriptional regulator
MRYSRSFLVTKDLYCYIVVVQGAISDQAPVAVGRPIGEYNGYLLAQLGRAATRRYRHAMAPTGLSPRETAALLRLEAGPLTQQDLGAAIDMDPSNLVALLNDLEAGELASRSRDPEDRRRHIVAITPRGIEMMNDVRRIAGEVEDDLQPTLSEQERETLRSLLARVADALDVPPLPDASVGEEDAC